MCYYMGAFYNADSRPMPRFQRAYPRIRPLLLMELRSRAALVRTLSTRADQSGWAKDLNCKLKRLLNVETTRRRNRLQIPCPPPILHVSKFDRPQAVRNQSASRQGNQRQQKNFSNRSCIHNVTSQLQAGHTPRMANITIVPPPVKSGIPQLPENANVFHCSTLSHPLLSRSHTKSVRTLASRPQ